MVPKRLTLDRLHMENLPPGFLEERGIPEQEAQDAIDLLRILVVLEVDTVDKVVEFLDGCDDVPGSAAWMVKHMVQLPPGRLGGGG